MKYPRYFITTNEEKYDMIWITYATVKRKGGYIYYKRKRDGMFGRGGREFQNFPSTRESFANDYVERKEWKEVRAEELVLLI